MKKLSLLILFILILSVILTACKSGEGDFSSLEPEFTDDSILEPADEAASEFLPTPQEDDTEDIEGEFLDNTK